MKNGNEGSLQDHSQPAGRAWPSLARVAILALAMLALAFPFSAQVALAGAPAPAVAPQQAGDDNGEDTQDGEDNGGEEDADASGTEEDDNTRFYVLLGIFSFVAMLVVGVSFAVFGYMGSGR